MTSPRLPAKRSVSPATNCGAREPPAHTPHPFTKALVRTQGPTASKTSHRPSADSTNPAVCTPSSARGWLSLGAGSPSGPRSSARHLRQRLPPPAQSAGAAQLSLTPGSRLRTLRAVHRRWLATAADPS